MAKYALVQSDYRNTFSYIFLQAVNQCFWVLHWDSKQEEETSTFTSTLKACSSICHNLTKMSLGHLMGAVTIKID